MIGTDGDKLENESSTEMLQRMLLGLLEKERSVHSEINHIPTEDEEWMNAPLGTPVDTEKLKAMSKRLTDVLGPAFEENEDIPGTSK
jgi:hypothetical protein